MSEGETNPKKQMGKALDPITRLDSIMGLSPGHLMPAVVIEQSLNVTARRLGEIMPRLDLFFMNGELVHFDHLGEKQPMDPLTFITWITDHVITCRKYDSESGHPIPCTMNGHESAVVLASKDFKRGVRQLKGINHVRLPVLRAGKALELLPWGYDAETQIYTVPGGLEFSTEIPLEAAKGRFHREFTTFPLTDDRSMAVQIAAMLAVFIRHLPGGTGLRPGFLWYANKPGCGKSVLAKAILYPVLGHAAVAKLKKDSDLDKEMEAFCRAGVPYIFLDNIRGGLNSPTIEQMLTSEESTGRAMGGHGLFTARNTALLLATANQLDLTEDALRRFLLIDLFEKGDPQERKVEVILNDGRMKSDVWRASMLEAMWALVEHWHKAGMQAGTVRLASFEDYAGLLGGIVEAAGYAPPFTKAELADAKAPGAAEFDELLALVLEEMGLEMSRDVTVEDLARLARSAQLYHREVGTQDDGKRQTIKDDALGKDERGMARDHGYMNPSQRNKFGTKMTKQVGTEHTVGGRKVEFGKREQARKATYTVRVLG